MAATQNRDMGSGSIPKLLAQLALPAFRYHPNPLETGAFEESADGVVCDCCGKTTHIFYTAPFYAVEDIAYLCPECIANGEAARKYDGSFQDDFSVDDGVDDPEKLDELIHRTPGYSGWQQEYWRAHCGDYCAYLGNVGARELRALGVLEEVLDDPMWEEEQKGIAFRNMLEAYEALRSDDKGSRAKTTKEGFLYSILTFLEKQGLIEYVEEDEMVKTSKKLDNLMDWNLLNQNNYQRVRKVLEHE